MLDLIVSVPDHCLSFYFAVRMNITWVLSYPLSGSAQSDLSLRWVVRSLCLVCFVMLRHIYNEIPITWSNSWFGEVGADDDAKSLSTPGCVLF